MEESAKVFLRPVKFDSQQKLFAWIERSEQQGLARVRTLTLRLTEIDLSPLLDRRASNRNGTGPSAWNLYKLELERLDGALRFLPDLEHLTVVPPSKNKSSLLHGIYRSFLSQVPVRCLRLKCLTLYDHKNLLEKIPALSSLPQIDFEQPTPSPSLCRSPNSSYSRLVAEKGKAREAVVKMEVDSDTDSG